MSKTGTGTRFIVAILGTRTSNKAKCDVNLMQGIKLTFLKH
jgi:hypothetical protein